LAQKVTLKIAVGEYPHTSSVRSGAIPIEGVDAEIVTVEPQIAAFRRMVRSVEFDVCELALTTYMCARAYGAPFVALPIFTLRRFHHSGLLVRPDAGIQSPKDLEWRKVGVRAYSVTTGVWTRSILMDDYDVDLSKVTWVVDDEEHVTQLKLPPNVVHTPEETSLAEMMAKGELAAGFAGPAGVGRSGAPTGGWKTVQADYPELFPNALELEAAWHERTGIYPVHGTIVVKDSLLAEHPWVAKSLFDAFNKAKNDWLATLDASNDPSNKRYAALRKIVGADPMPHGMAYNLPTIKALESAAFRQGLTPRRMPLEELFVNPETV
jgi:4,5-dihydroxyphthalate decarboxylase